MAVRSSVRLLAGATLLSLLAPAVPAQGWTETVQLTKAAAAFGDRFGTSVAILGDTFAVGAPDDNNTSGQDAGIAQLFERDQGGANTRGKVANLEPERLATARDNLERIEAQWDAALERLEAFLENE